MASPVYIGNAQGEEEKKKKKKAHTHTHTHIKRGAKTELGWGGFFSSPRVFCVGPPSRLKDAFSCACQIKLSCNM